MPSKLILQSIPTGPAGPEPKLWFKLDENASPAVNSGSQFPSATFVPVGYGDAYIEWGQAFPDNTTAFPKTVKNTSGSTSGVGGCAALDPLGGKSAMTVLLWTDWPTPGNLPNSNRIIMRGDFWSDHGVPTGMPQFGIFMPAGGNAGYCAITGVAAIEDGVNSTQLLSTDILPGATTDTFSGVCLWALRYDAGVLKLRLYPSAGSPLDAVSTTLSGTIALNTSDNMVVGSEVGSGGRPSPNNMYYSDFRVYDVALTDAQLDAIWAASIAP